MDKNSIIKKLGKRIKVTDTADHIKTCLHSDTNPAVIMLKILHLIEVTPKCLFKT